MNGATAANDSRFNHTNSSPPQLDLNGTRHPGKEDSNNNNTTTNNNNNNNYNNNNTINNNNVPNGKMDIDENHHAAAGGSPSPPMTTLKMKLPDVRKGGNTIQISLEVGGVLYEGKISAKLPTPIATTNGHYNDVVATSEAEPMVNGGGITESREPRSESREPRAENTMHTRVL